MAEPITLDDAKAQLRHYDEELTPERQAEIEGFIADAMAWVERYTGHILVARTVAEEFGGLDRLRLRAWPIKADAAISVSYDAGSGTVAVDGARLWLPMRPAAVLPPIGSPWPAAGRTAPVTVTVRAGYEPTDSVPGNFRRAMLILISGYDADREGGDLFAKAEDAARRLCRDFRRNIV